MLLGTERLQDREKNREDIAGWKSTKRAGAVLLMTSEPVVGINLLDDDDLLLVPRGQRTYFIYSRMKNSSELPRIITSRSVRATSYYDQSL